MGDKPISVLISNLAFLSPKISEVNSNERSVINTTWFSIAGNVVLALIKGIAGILGNSYALIADAIESTPHAAHAGTDIDTDLPCLRAFLCADGDRRPR